jgi:hypothetical protein
MNHRSSRQHLTGLLLLYYEQIERLHAKAPNAISADLAMLDQKIQGELAAPPGGKAQTHPYCGQPPDASPLW